MTLEEFNNKYVYKTDRDQFGFDEVWEIPKLQADGKYYGDCESYCRFLKSKIDGFSDWKYWYCKINGEGHCLLYKDGYVIDCNIKQVTALEKYSILFNATALQKYSQFTVFSKIVLGWGFLVWLELKKYLK